MTGEARSKWRITFEVPADAGHEPVRYVYDGEHANPVTSLGNASDNLFRDHRLKAAACRIVLEPVHRGP